MPGVKLTFIPSKQFKTIRINISFAKAVASKKELAMRTLIANVLEMSSQNYPDQKKVSDQLALLYGATFGTSVNRRGNLHLLSFEMRVVNDRYLKQKANLLFEACAFLKEVIFNPLIQGAAFEEATFLRQQKNLIAYIDSVQDNKQAYALQSVQEMYFEKAVQKVQPYGDSASIAQLTASECYTYYQKMLAEDEVNIVLSGDVEQQEVLTAMAQFNFTARKENQAELVYQQEQRDFIEREESQSLSQSKLDLAYALPVAYRSELHYAALVFNALFGGSALSKLFVNVREKESLAYYANSSFDSFRQVMFVQTGIQAENKEKVFQLITKQLEDLKAGKVEDELLVNIKQELLTDYEIRQDSQAVALIQEIVDSLSKSQVSPAEWKAKLLAVTIEDVKAVAKLVHLEASYFLKGAEVN